MFDLLFVLGKVARIARAIGLGGGLDLVRDSVDRFCLSVRYCPLSISFDGLVLVGHLRHRSFLHGLAAQGYEPFSRQLYLASLVKDGLVVDGGAHLGLYSLVAARRLGERGRVIAFEPDPYSFSALDANCGLNGSNFVRRVPKALADKRGRGVFYQSAGTICSSLIRRKGMGRLHEFNVDVTTLDEELADHGSASVLTLKLDIEGAELLALKGMRRTLDAASDVRALVEYNPNALRDAEIEPRRFVSSLRELGFAVYFVHESDRRLTAAWPDTPGSKGNLFCVKPRGSSALAFVLEGLPCG